MEGGGNHRGDRPDDAALAIETLEEHGYAGLADRRKGKAASHRVALATVEKVLGLYGD